MSKTSAVVVGGFIVLLASARYGAAGLIGVGGALFGVYVATVRFNPRIPHRACRGTGRRSGWIVPWAHHRDQECLGSGRVLRWGAKYFGMPAIRAEAVRQKAARSAAKTQRAWR